MEEGEYRSKLSQCYVHVGSLTSQQISTSEVYRGTQQTDLQNIHFKYENQILTWDECILVENTHILF